MRLKQCEGKQREINRADVHEIVSGSVAADSRCLPDRGVPRLEKQLRQPAITVGHRPAINLTNVPELIPIVRVLSFDEEKV